MKSVFLCFLTLVTSVAFSFQTSLWTDVNERGLTLEGNRYIIPNSYRAVATPFSELNALLQQAPHEDQTQAEPLVIELPMPDGSMQHFEAVYSPIMEAELEVKFPSIRTYKVWGIDDTTAQGRLDLTPSGFHAMILRAGQSVWIDPITDATTELYQVYERKDAARLGGADFICHNPGDDSLDGDLDDSGFSRIPSGGELREYRIAISTTFEYSNFHGGTTESVLAAIVTAMNRVNGIYERDLAIRMNIIGNNDQIIFLTSDDPFTDGSPGSLINENQNVLDNIIGSDNYDIGHNFSTGGGGLAGLGVVCAAGAKARGITGLSQPVGDVFYVDFVAHELGHQWDAPHTFNGTTSSCGFGNRTGSAAYEPGGGTTIMAYAGICGSQNVQNNSDDYFHIHSLQRIYNYSRNGFGANCAQVTVVDNPAPTVDAGQDYVIPANTPFVLNGSATDTGSSTPTFCWEQYDLGPASPPDTDDGARPIFRSFSPTTDSRRYFPRLSDILTNSTTYGESLPTTDRDLTFRLTVRDNHPTAGGVNQDEMVVQVDADAGPFRLTSPNAGGTFSAAELLPVTWDVANTTAAPVSASTVDFYISLDSGQTFELLLTNIPNTGAESIQLPNLNTTTARLMIRGSNNIFLDISDADFAIEEGDLTTCYTNYGTWNTNPGDAAEVLDNGRIDVADLIFCNFIDMPARPAGKRLAKGVFQP